MKIQTSTKLLLVIAALLTGLSQNEAFAGQTTRIDFQQRMNNKSVQFEPYHQLAQPQNQVKNNAEVKILHFDNSAYVIHDAKYTASLDEDVVTVNGKVTFETFRKKGITLIPIVDTQVGLMDVKLNRGKATVTSKNKQYYLIVQKPGKHVLEVEYLKKAIREEKHGPGNFNISVLPAPISQFEMVIPEKEVQIIVDPAIKTETERTENKTTAWAILPNTQNIAVHWTRALPQDELEEEEQDPKIYVETTTHAAVGGGVIRSIAHISYSILQAPVSSFRIAMPADVSILDVKGMDLRDWRSKKSGNKQILEVLLNMERKGSYALNLTYERAIKEGSSVAQMPWTKALGAKRENGFYGISASTNVELTIEEAKRATKIDARQLPSTYSSLSNQPALLAFKYLNHPFEVAIEITRHEELPVLIAAVDQADHLTLHTQDGKILTKSIYHIRNNVKQYLRLTMPEGSSIWSAYVAGKPVKPAQDQKGHVLIPLKKSQQTQQNIRSYPVEIVYLNKGNEMSSMGKLDLDLPKIDIPINAFYWSVYFPHDYLYYKFSGDLKEIDDASHPFAAVSNFVSQGNVFNNYVSRGVQGRLKSATDDIGQQFDPGNTSGVLVSRKNSYASQSTVSKGVLPIKINVPRDGQLYQFSKLLVIEGESPHLSVKYSSFFAKAWKLLIPFLACMIVVLIFIKIYMFIYKPKKKKNKTTTKEQTHDERTV